MSRNSLLEAGAKSEGELTATGLETQNHLVLKRTLNHLVKLAKWSSSQMHRTDKYLLAVTWKLHVFLSMYDLLVDTKR